MSTEARENLWAEAFGMEPAQFQALMRLVQHRDYDDRPCKDAKVWDIPRARGVGAKEVIAAQVDTRTRLCVVCPVFDLCAAYAATNPPVTGVLAGTVSKKHGATA